jgi:hypothetical protein
MAQLEGLAIPTGMLRISKQGEQDRVIYPVHADGWRKIGWTVHPPAPEEEDEEEEMGEPQPAPGADPVAADFIASAEPPGGQAEPPPAIEQLDFEGMTKAEIVSACESRFGVTLDSHMMKAELIAEANRLALQAVAQPSAGPISEAEPLAGEDGGEEDGSLVPPLL